MRILQLFLAVLTLCLAGLAYAQGFTKFTSELDRFEIHTPGELVMHETTFDSEYGAVFPTRVYGYSTSEDKYSVTVVDYTDARGIHAERAKNEADYELYWEVDVRASIAYAAAALRARGGQVTYDAYHYIDRVEGHQLQITNDDRSFIYMTVSCTSSRRRLLRALSRRGFSSSPCSGSRKMGAGFDTKISPRLLKSVTRTLILNTGTRLESSLRKVAGMTGNLRRRYPSHALSKSLRKTSE